MRKKLLSEAQVRRFQSLASIKPLNEMDSSYKKHDDEDKMEEAMHDDEAAMKDDVMEGEDEDMDEALYEEDDMDMDMDADEDMGDADVELDEELVDQFMDAVKTIEQVADALGGAGAGEDMDLGGDDLDMDMGGEEGGDDLALDAGGEKEDEEEMLQEALRGISYVPSQKEVVKLVAKRVAKRLQEAKRAEARLNRALGKRR
tara:strand:+ start:146 stop:751 length:606 start_codon:yes stop_codon:yes gene_type:complete